MVVEPNEALSALLGNKASSHHASDAEIVAQCETVPMRRVDLSLPESAGLVICPPQVGLIGEGCLCVCPVACLSARLSVGLSVCLSCCVPVLPVCRSDQFCNFNAITLFLFYDPKHSSDIYGQALSDEACIVELDSGKHYLREVAKPSRRMAASRRRRSPRTTST